MHYFLSTPVKFTVIERVPVDGNGKRTDLKSEKKGYKKYYLLYEGSGVKATENKTFKRANGTNKKIKKQFKKINLKRISRTPDRLNKINKNLTKLSHNRVGNKTHLRNNILTNNNKKIIKKNRNNLTQQLNNNYRQINNVVKK